MLVYKFVLLNVPFQNMQLAALAYFSRSQSFIRGGSQLFRSDVSTTLHCRLSQILSFALTLKSDEAKSLGLPDFPLDNLHAIIKILVCMKDTCLTISVRQAAVAAQRTMTFPYGRPL